MGSLTFDNDADTKAGTYRNQALDKKGNFLVLRIFFGLKWRRDSPRNLCSIHFFRKHNSYIKQ